MVKELKIVNFINSHKNWRELLVEKPYYLNINEDNGFILLKYSQIDSDFSNDLVKECRGIILKEVNSVYEPACVPFYKFFNYGESNADIMDWSSVRVLEKIDGSLIKIWWDGEERHISTNGCIDAFKAELPFSVTKYRTYGDLVLAALEQDYQDFVWDKSKIYMFELCSPYNRVVVPHKELKMYWLGTRDKATLQEEFFDPSWKLVPKTYNLDSLESCVNAASVLPFDDEGYVVVDKDFNRVKVKSPAYVALHHTVNGLSKKSFVVLAKNNELEEFLTYFPEYTDYANEVKEAYDKWVAVIKDIFVFVDSEVRSLETRKEQALMIQSRFSAEFCGVAFGYLSGKINSLEDYLKDISENKLKEFVLGKD